MLQTCMGNEGPSLQGNTSPPSTSQNTLVWVSFLSVSWLQHGSSVISSDCKMKKARVGAFVLCTTV